MIVIQLVDGGRIEVKPSSIPSKACSITLHNGGSISVTKPLNKEEAQQAIDALRMYVEI